MQSRFPPNYGCAIPPRFGCSATSCTQRVQDLSAPSLCRCNALLRVEFSSAAAAQLIPLLVVAAAVDARIWASQEAPPERDHFRVDHVHAGEPAGLVSLHVVGDRMELPASVDARDSRAGCRMDRDRCPARRASSRSARTRSTDSSPTCVRDGARLHADRRGTAAFWLPVAAEPCLTETRGRRPPS